MKVTKNQYFEPYYTQFYCQYLNQFIYAPPSIDSLTVSLILPAPDALFDTNNWRAQ
jgi:hypothetical protein